MKTIEILQRQLNEEANVNPAATPATNVPETNVTDAQDANPAPAATPAQDVADETFAQRKSRIINAVKLAGGRTIKASVIGVTVGEIHESGAASVSFSLDRKVKTADAAGATSVLWDTTFGIFSQMKHDASLAMFMPIITQHPKLLSFLLAGANVEFLLQDVVAGEPFVNPFSETQKQSVTDKDRTLSWVTNIVLSEQAKSLLQAILFGQVNVAQLEANIL